MLPPGDCLALEPSDRAEGDLPGLEEMAQGMTGDDAAGAEGFDWAMDADLCWALWDAAVEAGRVPQCAEWDTAVQWCGLPRRRERRARATSVLLSTMTPSGRHMCVEG